MIVKLTLKNGREKYLSFDGMFIDLVDNPAQATRISREEAMTLERNRDSYLKHYRAKDLTFID